VYRLGDNRLLIGAISFFSHDPPSRLLAVLFVLGSLPFRPGPSDPPQ